jgi:hypothetical protein
MAELSFKALLLSRPFLECCYKIPALLPPLLPLLITNLTEPLLLCNIPPLRCALPAGVAAPVHRQGLEEGRQLPHALYLLELSREGRDQLAEVLALGAVRQECFEVAEEEIPRYSLTGEIAHLLICMGSKSTGKLHIA